jgi:hypothetical protein
MVNLIKDMHVLSNTKIQIQAIRETQFLEKGTENVLSWWIRIQNWMRIRKNSMQRISYNIMKHISKSREKKKYVKKCLKCKMPGI